MPFDLSKIFIGRKRQLSQFRSSLDQWKRQMDTTKNIPLVTSPSPNDKIQGLVVLLYGSGGTGKTTLLKHYHEIATEPSQNFVVSKIIDWEFEVGHIRSLFTLAPGQEVDALK